MLFPTIFIYICCLNTTSFNDIINNTHAMSPIEDVMKVLHTVNKGGMMNTLENFHIYRVILSVLDPRKCEYLKDYSLDFEHAYMATCLAS